jgi:hypothetical protein
VFIGSSSEGKRVADYVQVHLDEVAECTVWSQGALGLSSGILESLCDQAKRFDFAVLVMTPDDLVEKRDGVARAPRDNVVFELGLFIGTLGRSFTFIVADEGMHLPSDLAGIKIATWRGRSDGNLEAALGPPCTKIRDAIRERFTARPAPPPDPAKLVERVAGYRKKVAALAAELRLAMDQRWGPRDDVPKVLEGTWRDLESGSYAYGRAMEDQVLFPFCYGGNGELTGECIGWAQEGPVLTCEFRWLSTTGAGLFGHCLLRIAPGGDELSGVWLPSPKLLPSTFQRFPQLEGAAPVRWVRTRPGTTPRWVSDYYHSSGTTDVTDLTTR